MQIKLTYQKRYMQGGFTAGPPPPAAPIAPPTPGNAAANAKPGTRQDGTARQGYQSTILTDGTGVPNQSVAKKTLLGS